MRKKLFALALIILSLVKIVKLDYAYHNSRNDKYLNLEDLKISNKSDFEVQRYASGINTTNINSHSKSNETQSRALIDTKQLPTVVNNSSAVAVVKTNTSVVNYEPKNLLGRKHHHESYSDESYDFDDDDHGSYELVLIDDKDSGGHGHKHGHGHGHKKKKKKKKKKKFKKKFKKKGFKKFFKKKKQKKKHQKYMKKFMMPLLIAYKLKFFTLIPIFIAGLVLLVKTAGLAGFFFALFSVSMFYLKINNPNKSIMSLLSESSSSIAPSHSNHLPPHRNAATNVIPQYDNPSYISPNRGHNPNFYDNYDYYGDYENNNHNQNRLTRD
ncbi:hypothetical protein PVAND_002059 [Polypedilum vanderplanki]|uniref:Uncharacterized protein n=1 Tax=Polypedilum vanderplanki TaxID=319348 RepID=A0A9J6BQ55_POLVA|nr:hypothetical protein PVAND_002059 [Polypedilum vanderplanki]